MKKNRLTWAFYASALLAGSAHAASTIGTASAVVQEDLVITGAQPLNFGFISPQGAGGQVVISTSGTRSLQGGVQAGTGSYNRASFSVKGSPNRSYSITTPASQQFVSSSPSADPGMITVLTVDNFKTATANGGANNDGTLSATGQDQIYLGGTLHVPANAAPGVYSGLVNLTVSY